MALTRQYLYFVIRKRNRMSNMKILSERSMNSMEWGMLPGKLSYLAIRVQCRSY